MATEIEQISIESLLESPEDQASRARAFDKVESGEATFTTAEYSLEEIAKAGLLRSVKTKEVQSYIEEDTIVND